jgi:urease accessory protein
MVRVMPSLAATGSITMQPGRAALRVERIAGASTITRAFASNPLKLLTPRSRGPAAWAFLASFGGGYVAGDQTRLDVRVDPETRCYIGTQASTKIYRNPRGQPCGHQTRAQIAEGGLLVFTPDSVQPFAGATYDQHQQFHLAPGAGLVLIDWLSSGRGECGEQWAFRRFRSRNEIWLTSAPAHPVIVDSLLLDGSAARDGLRRQLGRYQCLALLLLTGPPLADSAARLLEIVGNRPVSRRGTLITSASPVSGGALLRVAGASVEAVRHELLLHLSCLPALLGGDPWSRNGGASAQHNP